VTGAGAAGAGRAVRRALIAACVAPGLFACSGSDVRRAVGDERVLYLETDSMGVVPAQSLRITVHARRELVENSAATLSHTQPGVYFTVNDSGNEPLLFAFDTTGADRGMWRVGGARNVDWESASVGPCGVRADSAAPPPNECVYIGDTGDNGATRMSRDLYRVAEPGARGPGFVGALAAQRLAYRYPDQPHDVEAMYVAPNADAYLITKRRLTGPDSRLRPALVFRIPASAWDSAAVQAQLVDSLPVVPGSAPMRQITDAALSPDGRFLAVRTYAQVYVFAADSSTGRVRNAIPPAVCNIVSLGRWQGEGVTWFGRSGKLLLTSEGQGSPVFAVDCPLPRSE
jgi:hypothetical protein